jgi:mono/diheme cytochrome c family protein
MKMKKIHALFIMTAPMLVLVSCAHSGAGGRQAQPDTPSVAATVSTSATDDRILFLRNCAHCHGADAHGDEGPDLHHLDWSDQQILTRIRNGKAGQMTAFAGKLQPSEINSLLVYIRTLK